MSERPVRTRRSLKVAAAVGIVLTLAAAAALSVVAATGYGDRIPRGVQVDGVDIGGLSPEEATRRLEAYARQKESQPVMLRGPRRTIRTSGAELAATARIDEVVAEAQAGRVGMIRHLFGFRRTRMLTLRFAIPSASLETLSARLGALPALDATVNVDADGIHVGPARNGRAVDVATLETQLSTLPSQLEVPQTDIAPRVTTKVALATATRARRLVDRPRTIVVDVNLYTLTPANLRSALTIGRAESGFRLGFDPNRLVLLLPAATRPRNAKFVVHGDRVRIAPSRPGRRIDANATAQALTDPTRETVGARLVPVRPRVSTDDLAALRIREQVSTFTTYYPPGQPRVVNIRRAASVIDGTILRSGATFSMNAVLGERTTAKGYVPAPQISGSSFTDSVGGGISQVATMLYNGAFFAGLQLVEHQPHSIYIDRYPPGREATISWGGPELIFRDNWPAAVLISLKAGESSIIVRFFSSRLGRRVETETYVPNGNGGGSFTVEYTRRVYRNGTLLSSERFLTHYGVAPQHGP
jgi:vancomycin resistance protein YoaR